jgi:hypothetical protein
MKSAPVNSCERPSERFWIWQAGEATVEFTYPDGCNWCCDLLNISESGVCFGLIEEQPALASGLRIDGAILYVGEVEIEGTLVVVHTTGELSSGAICGAEFMPATKADKRKLMNVISRLGTQHRQIPEQSTVAE